MFFGERRQSARNANYHRQPHAYLLVVSLGIPRASASRRSSNIARPFATTFVAMNSCAARSGYGFYLSCDQC